MFTYHKKLTALCGILALSSVSLPAFSQAGAVDGLTPLELPGTERRPQDNQIGRSAPPGSFLPAKSAATAKPKAATPAAKPASTPAATAKPASKQPPLQLNLLQQHRTKAAAAKTGAPGLKAETPQSQTPMTYPPIAGQWPAQNPQAQPQQQAQWPAQSPQQQPQQSEWQQPQQAAQQQMPQQGQQGQSWLATTRHIICTGRNLDGNNQPHHPLQRNPDGSNLLHHQVVAAAFINRNGRRHHRHHHQVVVAFTNQNGRLLQAPAVVAA